MRATLSPSLSESLAVSAIEAAEMLHVSERHIWALQSSGRIPRPVKLGRCVRWPVDELRDWLAAGAPERGKWENARTKDA